MYVHLVDATYELFRAYFGAPERPAPDNTEVGAVYGLLASMISLLKQPEVTHVACATDHVIESFRNDLFEYYKTGDGLPEDLAGQFPIVEDGMRALGLVVWPMIEFEADDAIATGAAKFQDQVERVFICSPDKDMMQCVNDSVHSIDRRREISYDPRGVEEKFGIEPASIPDYLALVGDDADGIPGLRGWGAKSSSSMLAEYKHIEKIPANADDWAPRVRGKDRLAEILQAEFEDALLYRKLATLRTDVPITENLQELAYIGTDERRWDKFCKQWGFDRLRNSPPAWR